MKRRLIWNCLSVAARCEQCCLFYFYRFFLLSFISLLLCWLLSAYARNRGNVKRKSAVIFCCCWFICSLVFLFKKNLNVYLFFKHVCRMGDSQLKNTIRMKWMRWIRWIDSTDFHQFLRKRLQLHRWVFPPKKTFTERKSIAANFLFMFIQIYSHFSHFFGMDNWLDVDSCLLGVWTWDFPTISIIANRIQLN